MAENPYAPPKSYVADTEPRLPEGDFIPEGRGVAAGNGWRWITDAWNFMAGQRVMFTVVVVLYWLMAIAVQFVPIIGPIVVTLLGPVIVGGFMLGCDAVRRGDRLEVGHLFAAFQRHVGKLVAIGAISFGLGILVVIVIVAIVGVSFLSLFVGGGEPSPEQLAGMGLTILLAVLVALAVSIPVYMLLWFAVPLIALADFEIGPALKTSFSACLKNILPFLVWGVMVLLLAIPATILSILLFLGWILLGPVIMVSIYTGYRDIFHDTAETR
jgi:hypothetical protein